MNRKGNRQHSPTPPKQKWQNIYLALCVLLGMLASCETEESFYQPRFPANNIPLTRQALFKPENFFAYTDSTLKAVISALRRVEEEKHFTAPFLLKYGIPLWNFTYQLTEEETKSGFWGFPIRGCPLSRARSISISLSNISRFSFIRSMCVVFGIITIPDWI